MTVSVMSSIELCIIVLLQGGDSIRSRSSILFFILMMYCHMSLDSTEHMADRYKWTFYISLPS